jgi:hypothetical protein
MGSGAGLAGTGPLAGGTVDAEASCIEGINMRSGLRI